MSVKMTIILIIMNITLTVANYYCHLRYCKQMHVLCKFFQIQDVCGGPCDDTYQGCQVGKLKYLDKEHNASWQGKCLKIVPTQKEREILLDIVLDVRKELTSGKYLLDTDRAKGTTMKVPRVWSMARVYYSMELERCVMHFSKQCQEIQSNFLFDLCCASEEYPYVYVYTFSYPHKTSKRWNFGHFTKFITRMIHTLGNSQAEDHEKNIWKPTVLRYFATHYTAQAVGCGWYRYPMDDSYEKVNYLCAFGFYVPLKDGDVMFLYERPNGTSANCGCLKGWYETEGCLCSRSKDADGFSSTTSTEPPMYDEEEILREEESDIVDIDLPILKNKSVSIEPRLLIPYKNNTSSSGEGTTDDEEKSEKIDSTEGTSGENNTNASSGDSKGDGTSDTENDSSDTEKSSNGTRSGPIFSTKTNNTSRKPLSILEQVFNSTIGEDYSDFQQVVYFL